MSRNKTGGWLSTAGNLYAADGGAQTTINLLRMERAPFSWDQPPSIAGVYPVGLAFDSTGNLFVSTNALSNFSGNDTILKFNPGGRR